MRQPTAQAALTRRPAAVSGHAMPLLLVEEDAAIAAVTAEIPADEGYQMDHVTTPAAALALVARQGPHADGLVLSNTFDPRRTQAYTWCDRLRTVTVAPVVLWSTAPRHVYADDRVHGAAAVVSTPFDIDALLALLATLVPHARAGRGASTLPAGAAPWAHRWSAALPLLAPPRPPASGMKKPHDARGRTVHTGV